MFDERRTSDTMIVELLRRDPRMQNETPTPSAKEGRAAAAAVANYLRSVSAR
jgi:hypothetical protein